MPNLSPSMQVPSLRTSFFITPILPPAKRPRARRTTVCHHANPTPAPNKKQSLRTLIPTAAAIACALILPATPSSANLLFDNTIFRRYLVVDSSAILRYALPLPSEDAPIRQVQQQLDKLGVHLRANGPAALISSRKDLAQLNDIISYQQLDILLDVPAKKRQAAATVLAELERIVSEISAEIADDRPVLGANFLPPQAIRLESDLRDVFTPRNSMKRLAKFDPVYVQTLRAEALERVADIEQIIVDGSGLPFRIPRRYNNLPRLTGRAKVAITLEKGSSQWMDEKRTPLGSKATFTAILDGYSAPLTAGNFIDLVQKHYYDNTPVLSAERNFYAQMGERVDDSTSGYVEKGSKERRSIPLEIHVQGERTPVYGASLDELGIGDLQPTLPLSAYGALAMVHSIEDVNDASSQFYIFMLEPTSYQARSVGGTALTGSLATFGYVQDEGLLLRQVEAGDRIASIKVVSGAEHWSGSGSG